MRIESPLYIEKMCKALFDKDVWDSFRNMQDSFMINKALFMK